MKTKEDYIRSLHRKIDEWDAEIDKLKIKMDRIDDESRAELSENIQLLKEKRDDINRKIGELNDSGKDAWQDLKSGMDLAWEAMNTAVSSATRRFFS
ncbi:MAG: hypothetical protein V2I35_07340 [Desulfocapsaceae bacterium]|jgi:predicted  nucleic acid-binding Zn-ribbon protein|nr:hypothetical protein [Desulfocapsaceae bacterium]